MFFCEISKYRLVLLWIQIVYCIANWPVPPLFKLALESWRYWQAALPSCSSQRSPSLSLLGGRGMSWENKLQTPYGTSSPCISWVSPRLIVSSPCVIPHESSCAFPPTPPPLPKLGFCDDYCAQYHQERPATSTNSTTLIFIKWGEQTAQVWAKRRQLFEQASLQEPSCTSDRQQL